MNHCGTCTACCNVYAIPELKKPAGKWCQHCTVGVGCNTYSDRPAMCVEFECLWLQSQQQPRAALPPELRPDRSRVVFSPTTNPMIMAAITMPGSPDAWRRKAPMALIDRLVKHGLRVAVGPPAALDVLLIDRGGEKRVRMTKPDANGMQWREDGGD